jgi:N-acetylmuramoyl-L-alanine amidase
MGAELVCLALTVYFEARSEPLLGQVAVAQVALNRVESPEYPDTLCEVVKQGDVKRHRCQFSYWCDGKSDEPKDRRAWRRAKVAATLAYEGVLDAGIGNATHYHATYVSPYWTNDFAHVATIGQHEFYAPIERVALASADFMR